MLRAGTIALAIAALAQGAPLSSEAEGKVKDRQFELGPPSTTLWWGNRPLPTALPTDIPVLLPPITGGVLPWGGKRDNISPTSGDGAYGNPGFDLKGLEKTLELLIQKYGAHPPHDVFVTEENIKHILFAYGITSVSAPDGTSVTITPSTRRSTPTATTTANYDISKLEGILRSALKRYAGASVPLADWLILQNIAAVLESYGETVHMDMEKGDATFVPSSTNKKRQGSISLGDGVDTIGLQALLAMLEAAYGSNPPRDIYLIEQAIASILASRGVTVPGFVVPGGPQVPVPGGGTELSPDPTVPGGELSPDPVTPGGELNPDPVVPGGPLSPSTRRRDSAPPGSFSVEGLQAALAQLEAQYGTYGSGRIPVAVFIIMQNIVTILQAEGVTVPGWPVLGDGSTVIGPSS